MEGLTLEERIAQGPLPVVDALMIASQIADALDAAHTAGVVHRDGALTIQNGQRSDRSVVAGPARSADGDPIAPRLWRLAALVVPTGKQLAQRQAGRQNADRFGRVVRAAS